MGFSTNIPIVGANSGRLITPQGYVRPAGDGWLITSNYLVEGDYFQTMHIPLIHGRYFDAGDEQSGAPLVTIISQSFADRYFRGNNPISMHVKVGVLSSPTPWITVVGVGGRCKASCAGSADCCADVCLISQGPADMGPAAAKTYVMGGAMVLVVRTTQYPKAIAVAVEKIVHQLNPLVPVSRVATMEEVVAATESSRRFSHRNPDIIRGDCVAAVVARDLWSDGVLGDRTHSRDCNPNGPRLDPRRSAAQDNALRVAAYCCRHNRGCGVRIRYDTLSGRPALWSKAIGFYVHWGSDCGAAADRIVGSLVARAPRCFD